jgi:hypothetical protein
VVDTNSKKKCGFHPFINESPLFKQGHPGLGAAPVHASIRAFNPAGAGHRNVDEMFSLTYCLGPV